MPACGWTIERCGCGGSTCWDGLKPAAKVVATTLAVNVLWAATGRRYGPCELTVMPCNPQPREALYQTFPVGYDTWGDSGGGLVPYIDVGGTWRNSSCGAGCRCAAACEVPLPGPVASVSEVTVDGEVIGPSVYEVHDGEMLVRIDGACWPTCVRYGDEIPGFTVTYRRGETIPPAVQAAAEMLACEFARSCTGGECRLPQRLASLTRQGVELAVNTIESFGDMIFTNIPVVDQVIAADNPRRLQGRPQVFSPDLPAPRVITWSGGS